jgi:hypothetical protein
LPSLSLLGTWSAGRLPALAVVVAVLAGVAAWDWRRFRDRSRTLRAGYLGFAFLLGGAAAWALWRPPAAPALFELVNIAFAFAVCLSVIQLYRGSETVLTLARGWMYLIGVLAAITARQRLALGPLPLSGPFPTPQHLATAAAVGLILMPLGHGLEHDRRLRWTYPVAALAAAYVIWSTHQALAVGVAVAVAAVWAACSRRGRWAVLGAAVAAGLVAVSPLRRYFPLAWHDSELTAGPSLLRRSQLVDAGMALLRETWFLGGGPGSYAVRAGEAWGAALPGGPPWSPWCPLVEVASQYGLAVAVILVLACLGLLGWCVKRLLRTAGRPWTSPERAPAVWLGFFLLALPAVGLVQPSWLGQPLTALIAGTAVLLARHVEEPSGRRAAVAQAALAAAAAGQPNWEDLEERLRPRLDDSGAAPAKALAAVAKGAAVSALTGEEPGELVLTGKDSGQLVLLGKVSGQLVLVGKGEGEPAAAGKEAAAAAEARKNQSGLTAEAKEPG